MKVSHWKDASRILSRTAMPLGLALGTSCLAFALYSCQLHPAASRTAAAGQAVDKSQYPAVRDAADAFLLISKKMMGLNPASNGHDHIGLMNIADMLGFRYPFNDCGANWVMNAAEGGAVTIFAPHANGKNENCRENDAAAPVHYAFKNWSILPDSFTEIDPYTAVPGKEELPPPPVPAAGAQILTDKAGVQIVDGRLVVTTPEEVSVTGDNPSSDVQNLSVNYTRAIANAHTITLTGGTTYNIGIGLTVTASGSLPPFASVSAALYTSFNYTLSKSVADATAVTQTTTVQCSSSINQKPGCSYRLKIIANYVQTKGRYLGYLRARPRMLSLMGRLNDSKDCQSKPFRNKRGTCDGQMTSETLGTDAISYDMDLENRLSGGDGFWYWQSLRSLTAQRQADGSANIDLAADYLTNGTFDRFAIRFDDVTESVTACHAIVEVVSGDDHCRLDDPTVSSSSR